MLVDPGPDSTSTCTRAEPWCAVAASLARLMAAFCESHAEASSRASALVGDAVFDLLTERDYCYLSKSRVAPYRQMAVACIERAARNAEPIDFSYDLGAGYHASLQPGIYEPTFDVGLAELFVLHQIATFARRVRSVYPPGVRFHIVIDNLCALLVNDIPVARTEGYCARFRELIEATITSGIVSLIVESEHFSVADFQELPNALASDGTAIDARARDNVARFLGRLCSDNEASARISRYREVLARSEQLLSGVIRGVHMTQRATPETICFRPFPGADSRIQCGEVALARNAKGRLCPFLLTSQNIAAYRCQRAPFPGILPSVIGEVTYAERLDVVNAPQAADRMPLSDAR